MAEHRTPKTERDRQPIADDCELATENWFQSPTFVPLLSPCRKSTFLEVHFFDRTAR